MRALIALGLFASSAAWAGTGEVSFTPTGLKFPITRISLAKNAGSMGTALDISDEQILYRCASTNEQDCLVDLTSQTDLDMISAAATDVTVKAGSYDIVTLYSCAEGKGGDSKVSIWLKGEFTAGGTSYVTSATEPTGIAAGTTADFTEISNWGCATHSIILATPLVIGEGAPDSGTGIGPTLSVLVDNTFTANSTPHVSPGMGGCKGSNDGNARGVCVNIPALLPYAGTETTTTKRFKLAHSSTTTFDDTKANAIVIVPIAGTTPLTVFAGPYFSETSAPPGSNVQASIDTMYGGPTYNTATDISSFKVNADGSIAFGQGGSLDSNAGVFTMFKLVDHDGTLTTRGGTTTWNYHAIAF